MKIRFEPRYALTTLAVLGAAILVATGLRDLRFIRGSVSDILATLFLYFLALTFSRVPVPRLAGATWLMACGVELAQLFHLADRLGLPRGSVLHILLGNTFSLADIACYALGVGAAVLLTSGPLRERTAARSA